MSRLRMSFSRLITHDKILIFRGFSSLYTNPGIGTLKQTTTSAYHKHPNALFVIILQFDTISPTPLLFKSRQISIIPMTTQILNLNNTEHKYKTKAEVPTIKHRIVEACKHMGYGGETQRILNLDTTRI
jgi:hypothetical protein